MKSKIWLQTLFCNSYLNPLSNEKHVSRFLETIDFFLTGNLRRIFNGSQFVGQLSFYSENETPLSSSEFELGSTVSGLCRPDDRTNKTNQRQFKIVTKIIIAELQWLFFKRNFKAHSTQLVLHLQLSKLSISKLWVFHSLFLRINFSSYFTAKLFLTTKQLSLSLSLSRSLKISCVKNSTCFISTYAQPVTFCRRALLCKKINTTLSSVICLVNVLRYFEKLISLQFNSHN